MNGKSLSSGIASRCKNASKESAIPIAWSLKAIAPRLARSAGLLVSHGDAKRRKATAVAKRTASSESLARSRRYKGAPFMLSTATLAAQILILESGSFDKRMARESSSSSTA
jgi:hypothetical protein